FHSHDFKPLRAAVAAGTGRPRSQPAPARSRARAASADALHRLCGHVVPFAFAVAAMLEGKLDSLWARWVRPWTTVAWLFLTLGIALGSWWAYYELGWGGWWFWDPVENASFMPWLIGT